MLFSFFVLLLLLKLPKIIIDKIIVQLGPGLKSETELWTKAEH